MPAKRPALPPLPSALAERGIALRPQAPGDRDFLRRLYGMQRAAELLRVAWPAAEKQRFLDAQFAAQSAHFAANHPRADLLVITLADPADAPRDIGRLYIGRTGPDWQLLEIALLPSLQGGGLGSAMIGWLIGAARAAGAAAVDLHVAIDNPRAEALYRRLGFADAASLVATHQRLRHDCRAVR